MELIKNTNLDFIGKRRMAYIFSAAVIIWGMIVFGMRGKENFSVDFIGGDMLNVEFSQKTSPALVREKIRSLGIGYYLVQALGSEGREFVIKSSPGTSAQIIDALGGIGGVQGDNLLTVKSKSFVAPSMSVDLRKKALYAFIVGMIGILLYLTIRFEFRFAVGATVAIFHDMLFALAVLALLRKQIDAGVVAALLTIAGYSVNDTVVIFDRIRENIRKTRSDDYYKLFNNSINETLSRTVFTVLTTLFVVSFLFFAGGEALHVFSLTLMIGFIIGTYSSVFVATSLLIEWHKLSPHKFKV